MAAGIPHTQEQLGAMLDHAQALYSLLHENEDMLLTFPVSEIANAQGQIPSGKIYISRVSSLLMLQAKKAVPPTLDLTKKGG